MKSLIIAMVLLSSFVTNAATKMTTEQREAYIEKIAKELRRDLWIANHEDVSSDVSYPSLEDLNEYHSDEQSSRYENPLNSEEVSSIYNCYYSRTCRVYFISVSSSYYSGYGQDGHFILLDIFKKSHDIISHNIYSE